MYTLNITKAIKMISVNEIRYLIFEIYHKGIGFPKESSHYSMNPLKKQKGFIVACKQINRKNT